MIPDLLVGFISGALVVGALWFVRAFVKWKMFVDETGKPDEPERWNDTE